MPEFDQVSVVLPIEVKHYEIARDRKWVAKEEKRLKAAFGPPDEEATRSFQNYHLPGQEFVRKNPDGSRVNVVRALLDPEEYVVKVAGQAEFKKLLELARENQAALEKGWKRKKVSGKPFCDSGLEIILGDQDNPMYCYRFVLSEVKREEGKLILKILGYEDRFLTHVETAKSKSIFFGQTGVLLKGKYGELAQRVPSEMRNYSSREIQFNPQTDHLWVVAVNAQKIGELNQRWR